MLARALVIGFALVAGCGGGSNDSGSPANPDTAEVVAVDRFSDAFAHLFARSKNPSLPAPNAPIDFDSGPPFITRGFGPQGQKITYYNFDVLPTAAAPIYVLFKPGATDPVNGQLNIIDVIPGDAGYNDFWRIVKVTVPGDYVANTVTSFDQITKARYPLEATPMLVNCPVVPDGSTAKLRYTSTEPAGLMRGWYKNKVVKYFTFMERALALTAAGSVPVSPIYVTFKVNPDPNNPASGPASGFLTENGTLQTHNVTATLPDDAGYSPLWSVNIYNNTAFSSVSNLGTATQAAILVPGAALVNCPVVARE